MTDHAPQRVCSFLAHNDGTTSASFSPDGQTLATGGYDCTVRLWNTVTWEEKQVLPGHRRGHVAFSPDGRLLISGGLHENAVVYDTATWQAKRTLYNTSSIWDLAFTPDGIRIAISQPPVDWHAPHRPVELRDTRTWRIAERVDIGANHAYAVAFHPDGQYATVAISGNIGIWSADFTQKLSEFTAHERAVWGLSFSPDGATLATGGADNVARLWDTDTWTVKHELAHKPMRNACHANSVLCVAFSPDGELLVTGGLDGALTVWRL